MVATFSLLTASAWAATSSSGNDSANPQAVAQSYNTDQPLEKGMTVGLKHGNSGLVEPLSQKTITDMQGVVISFNDAPVTLSPATAPAGQPVYVATFGRYGVLVSNQNGPIKPGDYITISSLSGIGMKADGSESLVVGKAAGSFDGTGNVFGSTDLKDSSGKKVAVSLGLVLVDLGIAHNPMEKKATNYVPGFLESFTSGIANKPVNAARIYLGLATLLVSAFLSGSLLYSGVKNGMVAVGRNPLARKNIIRNLVQVILVGLVIFILGIVAVYILLRL